MTDRIPNHVAIIPDGNRRYARERGLPTLEGHRRGFDALIEIGKKSREMGIKVMTVWGFSTENWKRAKEEVDYLMDLFKEMIDRYLEDAHKEEIRLIHLGNKNKFRESLRKKLDKAEEETKRYNRYHLGIALDYGGRDEIVRAVNKIIVSKKAKVDEIGFSRFLDTRYFPYPDPDLLIRTGGEKRLSGFLSWQLQYTELMFIDKYLPAFTVEDFEKCIEEFLKRSRRFGK